MNPTDWIIAAATLVIAAYSVALWRAAKLSAEKEAEFRERLGDLYQAITVATVLSSPTPHGRISEGSFGEAKKIFQRHYKGGTLIFEDEP